MSWHYNTGALLQKWMEKTYGDPYKPFDKYLIVDLETTGLSPEIDHVAQIGICCVNGDNTVVSSTLLQTPIEWFSPEALEITHFTESLIKEHGAPRDETLKGFLKFCEDRLLEGYALVGHNLLRFDAHFMHWEAKRVGMDFTAPLSALDTGLLVKAAQLDMWPEGFESFRDFLLRVDSIHARGIFWKLSGFCDNEFQLDDISSAEHAEMMKHGAHDAGMDCMKVHFLIKRFQEFSNDLASGAIALDDHSDPQTLFQTLESMCDGG